MQHIAYIILIYILFLWNGTLNIRLIFICTFFQFIYLFYTWKVIYNICINIFQGENTATQHLKIGAKGILS